MHYYTFKEKNKKEMNQFINKNVFFAFSNEQFEKGLQKLNEKHSELNLSMENYQDHLYSWVGGGFVLKSAQKEEEQMWKRMHKHERKYLSNFKNLVNALEYEMSNHECGYTCRYSDGLKALGYSLKDLEKNKKLCKAYTIARHKCWKWFIENN